jgi:CRP-like cAMP-binding protein
MPEWLVRRPSTDVIGTIPLFKRVRAEDRDRIAAGAELHAYARGDRIFDEGDDSAAFLVVVSGRVKVSKQTADGRDLILEMFGPGGPLGAVAVYESRPYPASAVAIEPTTCLAIPRQQFFDLLERHPSLVRGLLGSLSLRLVELTTRLAELTGARVDARLALLFLKLADQIGEPARGGIYIPLALSRQELADLTGTTIESAIRVLSRWGKEDVLSTEKDGFVILDRRALERVTKA